MTAAGSPTIIDLPGPVASRRRQRAVTPRSLLPLAWCRQHRLTAAHCDTIRRQFAGLTSAVPRLRLDRSAAIIVTSAVMTVQSP
jgi:hypothetical protein